MSTKVFSATPVQSVSEAAQVMVEGRVGSVVVIDGPWLVGIFTERDALRAAGSGSDLTAAKVRDWMTPEPITVTSETDVEEAATLMATHGFRHLPVLDGDTVVGMVSLRDLLSARIRRPRRPG
ncbi:MAG: CBS domain-containing protein [Acidimicrobiia bacterium]